MSDRIDNLLLPEPQRRRPLSETLQYALLRDVHGELHHLYAPAGCGYRAHIGVRMRSTKQRRVVASRSFLHNVLHELCHYIVHEYLKLAEAFLMEGVCQRESGLFRHIVHVAEQQEQVLV